VLASLIEMLCRRRPGFEGIEVRRPLSLEQQPAP
jgi:hypothetical protein